MGPWSTHAACTTCWAGCDTHTSDTEQAAQTVVGAVEQVVPVAQATEATPTTAAATLGILQKRLASLLQCGWEKQQHFVLQFTTVQLS